MKAKNVILVGVMAIMLFAFALSASAATDFLTPSNNGTATNATAQTVLVQITAKATTANFTQLNITYAERGGANVTITYINVTNETSQNISVTFDASVLRDGIVDLYARPYNGTAGVTGTGIQNATMTVNNGRPAVNSMTPVNNLEDSTTITLTLNETADCRYSQTDLGYANMTLATVGNSTSPTVASPLRENSDRIFYFACQDEFQNQGPTFSQRLRHASSTSAFSETSSVGVVSGTADVSVQPNSYVAKFLATFSDDPTTQKVIGVVLFLAIVGLLIWLALKFL